MPLQPKGAVGKRPGRFRDGIWLGINEWNGEKFIGTSNGIQRARSIWRRVDNWDREMVENMIGDPWCHTGDGEDTVPAVRFDESTAEGDIPSPPQPPQ